MDFLKRLFGKKDDRRTDTGAPASVPELSWIAPDDNPWGMRLLDLRPITQGMLSVSHDPQMAANAISYSGDTGESFIEQPPEVAAQTPADIVLPVDPILAPGVLFTPSEMEHKWAIFFHQQRILFVRSWLRRVAVVAATDQHDRELRITELRGQFHQGESPEMTRATALFLLVSHAIGRVYPTPLPAELADNPRGAGMWAMTMHGNRAYYGTFDLSQRPPIPAPLRAQSLLHIAAARGDIAGVAAQLAAGLPLGLQAADGLTPLHWALVPDSTEVLEHLLQAGGDPDARSAELATPLMNAVQSQRPAHMRLLLARGADVNAQDHNGFTALHRAAEMGLLELAELLLAHGARADIAAQGHTPRSLAELRGHSQIAQLLGG